ncbi:MAG: hypothetical protein AAGI52_17345 [Bacteroidota bacterium]
MKSIAFALVLALVPALLSHETALDLPTLRGSSPSVLATALGAPAHVSPAPEQTPFLLHSEVFELTVGTTTGVLAVTYCDDQAFAFELTLADGQPSAAGLLVLAGFDTTALTLERSADTFARWSGGETEHLVTTATAGGWDRAEVEYDSYGC